MRNYSLGINRENLAFTLIELLVVISIVGLLSTLAITALNNARIKARDVKRISDLKQMRTLIEIYINDNGIVPGSTQNCYRSTNSAEWTNMQTWLGQSLPQDPRNGESDYMYAFFRSNYAPGLCNVTPECGWLMTKREKDNYIVIMPFFKSAYSDSTVADSWKTGVSWTPGCGGSNYSGYVIY